MKTILFQKLFMVCTISFIIFLFLPVTMDEKSQLRNMQNNINLTMHV